MPPKTQTEPLDYPKKLFYKINEVSSIAGVEAYVLRYWESKFPMLAPEKDENDQRRYRQKDIELVLKIKHLLYDEKYTIAGAVEVLKKRRGGRRKQAVCDAPAESDGFFGSDAPESESQGDEAPHVILIVEDQEAEAPGAGSGMAIRQTNTELEGAPADRPAGVDSEALRTFQTRLGSIRMNMKRLIADVKDLRSTLDSGVR